MHTSIRLVGQDTTYDQETVFACDVLSSDATPFTPVPPGTYTVQAQLLDSSQQPASAVVEATSVLVEPALVSDTVSVTFDATDLN